MIANRPGPASGDDMNLTFTSTATRTPSLIARTFASFAANLHGVDMAQSILYLNVDPVGDSNIDAALDAARPWFKEVVANCPMLNPSFPRAVKWCFTQPDTAWAMHVEADWVLTEPVHIDQLLAVGSRVVNLRAHARFGPTTRCFLSPGLWDTMLMHDVGEAMNEHENPECQLWRLTDGLRCGHYYGDKPLVKDIGREWLEKSGWSKDTPKPERGVHHWTHWNNRCTQP